MFKKNPKIKIGLSTYPDGLDSGLFHFKAEGPLQSEGFGSDFDESMALIKAVTECAERHCLRNLSPQPATSNGFAGHSSSSDAQQKAYLELVERDCFLVSWLAGRSPNWLSLDHVDYSAQTRILIQKLIACGFELQVGLVGSTGSVLTLVGVLTPGKQRRGQFGVVFGCASAHSIEKAGLAVAIELARAATVIQNRIEHAQIQKGGAPLPETRLVFDGRSTFEHYLNPKHISQFEKYLNKTELALELPEFPVEYDFFKRDVVGPPLQLHVAWAKSLHAQSLFFGDPTENVINRSRFLRLGLKVQRHGVMPLP